MSQHIPRFPRLLAAVTTGLLLLGAAGCGDDDPSEASSSGGLEKTKLKVGILPIIDTAPVQIAKDDGMFAAEGLEVETVVLQGGPQGLALLQGNELDVSFGNYMSFITAQSKGSVKLKFASDGYQAAPGVFLALVNGNSPIRNAADLEGKTVGINVLGNISELVVNSVVRTNDGDWNKINYKAVPFPDMGPALERGDIDAALTVEPFSTALQQTIGARSLFDAATGPTADIAIAGYAATQDWASKNPNTFAAFQRAMSKAQEKAADRARVEKALLKYTPIDAKTASLVKIGVFPTNLNATRLQRLSDLMVEYGILKSKFDASGML